MTTRLRHCVECPRCRTRYLPGFSPYSNGSYLRPLASGAPEEWMLYCACSTPPACSRWHWSELKIYAVSGLAHAQGFGTPGDIAHLGRRLRTR